MSTQTDGEWELTLQERSCQSTLLQNEANRILRGERQFETSSKKKTTQKLTKSIILKKQHRAAVF